LCADGSTDAVHAGAALDIGLFAGVARIDPASSGRDRKLRRARR
jgi:hypothetical protein